MEVYNTLATYVKRKYYLFRYIYPFIKKNKNREITPENTICTFGFMRSGTTWFADLLHSIPNSCIIDEPLLISKAPDPHKLPNYAIAKVKETKALRFYYYQPIPRGADWKKALSFFDNLLKGKIKSSLIYSKDKLPNLMYRNIFIFQFNQANLLSRWLIQNYNFKAIYLIRNPYAVISSILLFPHCNHLKRIDYGVKIPNFRFNEVYLKYKLIYHSIDSIEEYFAFLWSVNMLEGPLKETNTNSLIVFYEDLLVNFKSEIERIFKFLQKPVPENIFNQRHEISLSTMSHSLNNIKDDKQLEAWKTKLSPSKKERIKRILDEFDIHFYNNPNPDKEKFYKYPFNSKL